jgi:hypothetical protein
MRALTIITAAGVVFATATFGFAQTQGPTPRVGAPLEAPECQRGALPTPVKRPVPPRSATSCRNQKALSVPRPELTRE